MQYNVNDNGISKTNYNDNVKARKIDEIADRLVSKLGNPAARRYYCLVAWTLPQNVIENNLEIALTAKRKGSDPKRYFTWLCQRDMP